MPVDVYPMTAAAAPVSCNSVSVAADRQGEKKDFRNGRGRARTNRTVEDGTTLSQAWRWRRSVVTAARGGTKSAVEQEEENADAQV